MWQNWLNGILGLWILISPFFGLSESAMTTNLVIVGIVVAVLGFWSAGMGKKMGGGGGGPSGGGGM